LRVSCRATADEAGPERQFDFSRRSIAARWSSGERDIGDLGGRESAFARLASMQAHRAGA
jgi:hypothetical protein